MAWTAQVRLDRDKQEVGSVSATWTEDDDVNFPSLVGDTVSHSDRVELTVAGRDQFIADAHAIRDAWRTRRQREVNLLANLLDNI